MYFPEQPLPKSNTITKKYTLRQFSGLLQKRIFGLGVNLHTFLVCVSGKTLVRLIICTHACLCLSLEFHGERETTELLKKEYELSEFCA